MLLQHYGSPTTLGLKCRATIESLQLEIGCEGNPLQECYCSRGILATPSWITSIWERSQQMGLQFYLRYESMDYPRENDTEIVALLLQHGFSGMTLRQMNRCRLALRAIFLSDIVTAGGRYLEHWVQGDRQGRLSHNRFAREEPTHRDWEQWDSFWKGWLNRNHSIPSPLGRWLHQSHQKWEWFYNAQEDLLWEQTDDGWAKHERINHTGIYTRQNKTYYCSGLWHSIPGGLLAPASITSRDNMVQIVDTGPLLAPTSRCDAERANSFWEFVWLHSGTWMWEHLEGKHKDMSWISNAMKNNTAMMVTDGSYNKIAPTISGAGWLLVCTQSLRMIRGSFYEESQKASSYRGELLGLTAIHHLAGFALDYYKQDEATGSVHCDNKGALHQASLKRKRVRTGCNTLTC
jgi:hypothetical protein